MARVDADWVQLVLMRRAVGEGEDAAPSTFTLKVCETFDANAILEATAAMERLRAEAARREADARDRHERALTAAARKPYDDALREVTRPRRRAASRRGRDAPRARRAGGGRMARTSIRRRARPPAPVGPRRPLAPAGFEARDARVQPLARAARGGADALDAR
jgi:hypothetical protein